MGKLVLGISAAITAFVLALTAGAVFVSRNLTSSVAVAQQPAAPAAAVAEVAAPVQAAAVNVAPQDAASIAAKYLNRTDLYSVEIAPFAGGQAYKVTFSSGDAAYVSLTGQMLSTTPAPTPSVITVAGGGGGGGGGGGHRGGGGEKEHEGGEGGD